MEGCQELPNTGPLEIILAIIVIAGICGGGYYLYRTRKTRKTVEVNVTGKEAPENDIQPEENKEAPKNDIQPKEDNNDDTSSQKPDNMVQ